MDTITLSDRLLPPLFSQGITKEEWESKRRRELLSLFRDAVYGNVPDEQSLQVSYRVADQQEGSSIMSGNALRKSIEVTVSRNGLSHSFAFVLFIPLGKKHPVPTMLTLCNRGIADADPSRSFLSSFWPAETIVSQGFAAAVVLTSDIAPDYDEGFSLGLHKLFPEYKKERPSNLWGALGAWAWALSRILDYLLADPLLDPEKIGVVGHSRGGKAALWCAAQDTRFALAVSSCSGCTGAALSRGKGGEHIKDITERFPYWFCKNYRHYADNEGKLPVDQHMLLALLAPRLVYVSSKTNDAWADPQSEFASCVAASEAYRLFGTMGIEEESMPRPEHPLLGGRIGYHLKTGYHDMDAYDWERYLQFAKRHLE
ncbi:prolyl oligopeptidase family protein [Sphaerochaeta pleomorpha str. Grapes]|uniref:Prolyl oligopeptidase family protein n=1 Tax=Sphaerochaeta pleomorpha (strain ATCC BAA-1885 / DSM 22778 / Grapes) TaxID=158190 RepID=G8QVR0_SPHPG|nr:prolyl oligopeptidase family serine peptidase [Sphaerochaeta pleomorpha]AEV29352.1 prolyl oligopeptidase family protein [Sphaerochaeta pleomorpha str. Grapes]